MLLLQIIFVFTFSSIGTINNLAKAWQSEETKMASSKFEQQPTISLTIPMDSNIIMALQNLVQQSVVQPKTSQQQTIAKPVVAKPKQSNLINNTHQPQKSVSFDERVEKVFIWEDYSNTTFTPTSPTREYGNHTVDKRGKIKRGREYERSDENPSPTKQLRTSPTTVSETDKSLIYDSKWYNDLSLSFCLTMQDYQEVAVQYVMHLLQEQQQTKAQHGTGTAMTAVEPIHSLEVATTDPPVADVEQCSVVASTPEEPIKAIKAASEEVENKLETQHVTETNPTSQNNKEDAFFADTLVETEKQSDTSTESLWSMPRRGSISEFRRNSITDLLFHRRGSLDFLFGDGFISKSRRNSIDFASVLLLQ